MSQLPAAIQSLLQQGDVAAVPKALDKAMAALPRQHQLMPRFATGVALMGQQAWGEAEQVFSWLHRAVPDHADSLTNLANCQLRQNKLAEAALSYHLLLQAKPHHWPTRLLLARILNGLLRFPEALSVLHDTLQPQLDYVEGYALLGQAQQSLYQFDAAKVSLHQACLLAPKDARHFFNYAMLLDLTRDNQTLRAHVMANLATLGATSEWQYWQAQLAEKPDEALTILDGALKVAPQNLLSYLHFARGRLLDNTGQHAAAFAAFAAGNKAQIESGEASAFIDSDYISHINTINDFAAAKPKLPNRAVKMPESQILFITGFPRSGTTLIGQILSMHGDVYVADEVPAINAMLAWFEEENLPYPQALPRLSQKQLQLLADRFWAAHKASPLYEDKPLFIDKMPLNCLHLALLQAVFPTARHIMMIRHPADCVLSAFMQYFRLNQALHFTSDLQQSAGLYDAVTQAAQSQQGLLSQMPLQCRYEDLVADLPKALQPVCALAGIAMQDTMLRFHEGKGALPRTLTPSHAQIRQGLYKNAAYRWQHYQDQMKPVLPQLQKWCDLFGYQM